MASLSLGGAARLTGLDKFTLPSFAAIKSRWSSGNGKKNGSHTNEPAEPAHSPSRLQALVPWHGARLADLRLMLAEERITELKSALEEMRAQRDAWQAMAQARIRPARAERSWRQWLRSTKSPQRAAGS
jgi:hypothetical protein